MRPRILALTLFLIASPLAAQIRYKDDAGETHFVDSIDQVLWRRAPGGSRGGSVRVWQLMSR